MDDGMPPEPKYDETFSNMEKSQAIQYLMTFENNTEERANERYNNWLYSIEEPKQHFESHVWDAYSPAPTHELQILTSRAIDTVMGQPFFGEKNMSSNHYMKDAQEKASNIQKNKLGIESGVINFGINASDKVKAIKKRDRTCVNCKFNKERVDAISVAQCPFECTTCVFNEYFTDNFELSEPEWPPISGQIIYCISATGQVHEREYDPDDKIGPEWISLVSCYALEYQANAAIDTLKRARELE